MTTPKYEITKERAQGKRGKQTYYVVRQTKTTRRYKSPLTIKQGVTGRKIEEGGHAVGMFNTYKEAADYKLKRESSDRPLNDPGPHAGRVSSDAKLRSPYGGPSSKAGNLALDLYDPKKVVHRAKVALPLTKGGEFIVLKRPSPKGEDQFKMYLTKPAQKGQKVGEVMDLGTHVSVDGAKAFSYHQGITAKNPDPDHQVNKFGQLVGVDDPNYFDLVRKSNARRAANRKLYL